MRFAPRSITRHLIFSVWCLSLVSLLSCQKEKSLETGGNPGGGSGGTAIFTLVPSGSNCSDAQVAGTYHVGTALTTNATITVTVNVTGAGTWTYATAIVNGFAFAGAGTFSTTGSQTITLQGVGTPVAVGSTTFSLTIGGAACSVLVPVIAGGPITDEIYYKATIDGVTYQQAVTATNGYEAGSGLGGVDDVSISAGIYYASSPAPAGSTGMDVTKGIMHLYQSATDNNFKAFFSLGDHPYAPAGITDFDNGDGVIVSWGDPTGGDWTSHTSTSDQTGSTFKIISVEDAYDLTGTYYIKVKMQFSCKLYNVTTGAVKQLTNGEMVGYFGKI